MKFALQPWQLMLIMLAGWINRQQQEGIEYLRTENAVLREKLCKKRVLRTDDQRRRLAVKGKIPGRKQLEQVGTLFNPDDPAMAPATCRPKVGILGSQTEEDSSAKNSTSDL